MYGNGLIGLFAGRLWLVFTLTLVVWGAFTNRRRPVVSTEQRGIGAVWPVVIIAIIALFIFNAPSQHFLSLTLWPSSQPTIEAGFFLELLGMGVAIWARAHIGVFWSNGAVLRQGHTVVSTGPYQLVRHPIYSGVVLAMVGSLLITGNMLWLVILGAYAAYAVWKALVEERLLTRELGDEYIRYRSRTRLSVPWLLRRERSGSVPYKNNNYI